MLAKIRTYIWTVRYMKPGQVFWRIGKRFGIKCTLKGMHHICRGNQSVALAMPELDFDPAFLARFDVAELMCDRVTFLHDAEQFCWEGSWQVPGHTPLWNYNLHYFEYLHPLCKCFLETGKEEYLSKTVQMIRGWIRQNPRTQGGDGWSGYTLSLRLTNWVAYLAAVGEKLDASFRQEMEISMYEQYVYLSGHLEKDILGNHYFENLKALVLCALFFDDGKNLPVFLRAFHRECREEILPDGMHFERSPMYHKIVLEGLLRVAAALRKAQGPDAELERLLKAMLDAVVTMENGLCRTPLFNDCGDNVAKGLHGLLAAGENYLSIVPSVQKALPHSGYYFLENGLWRLIVDAGAVGPDYIPGHGHCDAMSFELYRNGVPFLVNCGTFSYQCADRHYFRSTQAHNTVQVAGTEQSEIWSIFRLARRSRTKVLELPDNGIRMEMTDYKGNKICREIVLSVDSLEIKDYAEGLKLQSHLHSISEIDIHSNAHILRQKAKYAPEYGRLESIHHITAEGNGCVEVTVHLS